VLISAALQKLGKPRQTVVQAVLHGTLLASSSTVEELESRLRRSKFALGKHFLEIKPIQPKKQERFRSEAS